MRHSIAPTGNGDGQQTALGRMSAEVSARARWSTYELARVATKSSWYSSELTEYHWRRSMRSRQRWRWPPSAVSN